MKKSLKFAANLAILLFLSCGDKDKSVNPSANCGNNAAQLQTVLQTYAANPNKANCEAYQAAVRDFYKSCEMFYTGAAKKDLDDFLATPCK